MVSSFSIFFLIALYFYFKQYYEKLIPVKVTNPHESLTLNNKLKRKLMIFPAGVIAIVLLYIVSFVLINRYPDVDDVKTSRRVVDVVAALLCVAVFFMDKRELDKKLSIKKKPAPPADVNEPGIDIPEDDEIV